MIALLVIVFIAGVFGGVLLMGLTSMSGKSDRRRDFCGDCIFAEQNDKGER